jgi:hypothetical protein
VADAAIGGGVRGSPRKAGLEAARAPSRRKPVAPFRRREVSRLIGSPFRPVYLNPLGATPLWVGGSWDNGISLDQVDERA